MGEICAAYIRVSTHDQEEYSPDSQLKLIREYAERNGWRLPEEFIFRDDGISGRTAEKRPGFMRMIAAARRKPRLFQRILVWKFSRFARNQEESVVYKSLLRRENGIEVVSISEPLVEGPFGELIERIIEWFDAFYSANLGVEVRRGMTERASRGLPVSAAPYGYRYQDKALVVAPGEAEVVRMIYREFLSGAAMAGIAKKLNGQGVKTKRGMEWETRGVRYVLTNPTYAGKLRWCGQGPNDYHTGRLREGTIIVEGEHEALVSPQDFEAAQKRIAGYFQRGKARRQNAVHMLQGLVRCGACGGTMTYTGTGMNCSRYVHGKCRISHFVTVDKLEKLALYAVEAQMGGLELRIAPCARPDLDREQRRLEQVLRKEEEGLRRCKEAYAAGVDTLEEYRANKSASQERIAKVRQEVEALREPSEAAFVERQRDAVEELRSGTLTPQEKNEVLRGLVDHMVFHKETKELEVAYRV